MLIDTHAHVNFKDFKHDGAETIRRSLDNNVWMINVGSQYSTSERAVAIAEQYQEGVYAAVGAHPIYAQETFDLEKYQKLAEADKVVAVGEIGLDYKKEYIAFKEKQKEVLSAQLELAQTLNLPVIFHCRMAHDDLISMLNIKLRGVIHCFTGTWQQAEKYLNMGFYLGFNGIIFKLNLGKIIKKAPIDRLLIETDCPYLTPPQEQGRNEPLFVKYVAEKIAQVKNLGDEKIAEITTQNARTLFKI